MDSSSNKSPNTAPLGNPLPGAGEHPPTRCARGRPQGRRAVDWAADDIFEQEIEMTRNMSVVLYTAVMIAVVVSVDLLFFKNRFWERLAVNIGIVLVFAAFYLRFLKNP